MTLCSLVYITSSRDEVSIEDRKLNRDKIQNQRIRQEMKVDTLLKNYRYSGMDMCYVWMTKGLLWKLQIWIPLGIPRTRWKDQKDQVKEDIKKGMETKDTDTMEQLWKEREERRRHQRGTQPGENMGRWWGYV